MLNYTPYILKEIKKINKKDQSVLDVGCGIGQYFPYLKGKITGFDFDKKNVERAKKKFPEAKVFHFDLTKRPLPGLKKYDVVICLEVVEHMKKRDALLLIKELEKKTNGYLLISTPNINNFTSLLRFLMTRKVEIAGEANVVEKILYFILNRKFPPKNNKYYVMESDSPDLISNKSLHYHVSNFSSGDFKKMGYRVVGGLGQVNYDIIGNQMLKNFIEKIFYYFPYLAGSFLAIKEIRTK